MAKLETSNAKHPGLTIMQDGKSALDAVTIYDFSNALSKASDLLDGEGVFATFLVNALKDKKQFNQFFASCAELNNQLADFALAIKKQKGVVTVPDGDYFMKKLEEAAKRVDEGENISSESRKLADEFYKALTISSQKNLEEGKRLGINLKTNENTK